MLPRGETGAVRSSPDGGLGAVRRWVRTPSTDCTARPTATSSSVKSLRSRLSAQPLPVNNELWVVMIDKW